MKPYILLALLFGCSTANFDTVRTHQQIAKEEAVIELPAIPVEIPRIKVKTNIKTTSAREVRAAERIEKTNPMMEAILNSEEFKENMLKAWWNGKPGFQDTPDNPSKVWETITAKDWEQTYEFVWRTKNKFSKKCSAVTSYTYASTHIVWVNLCQFDSRGMCPFVGTRMHEQLHKFRYGHASAKRTLSAPYYAGTQATLLCYKLLKAYPQLQVEWK